MTVYSFKAITKDKEGPKLVEVTLSTMNKAEEARALILMEGINCTYIREIEVETNVQNAVERAMQ
jgi:hypothetical protein